MCIRDSPCFHDEYLPTFNRPNVTLVNTDGKGIDRITEKGVVANGQEYEVDCIIYASGFEVGTPLERRAGYEVYGKGGLTLSDKWKDGVATLHGMQTVSYTHLRAHETVLDLVCRLLLEKKKYTQKNKKQMQRTSDY